MIRQFFPKKMAFDPITDSDIQAVIDNLNHRPRKCAGFKTSHEDFRPSLSRRFRDDACAGTVTLQLIKRGSRKRWESTMSAASIAERANFGLTDGESTPPKVMTSTEDSTQRDLFA
ncbi:hypothetical protein RY831_03835 [Noviherbaspirillum sp. CPCC 100848]|uniref:Transposase n=1 Tax=Noviherbaspirillum album TaxID=3080276 RepID=A0ABU6J3R2_9BURK|nr:hypothetical protein [Noviherbaspirillum sp. CPCC 100848]MEC4718265.1 hypothetical protein [Noviherbaspirillum sp. CPCC 100848]